MTIKSASVREVKGKEALRGKRGISFAGFLVVLACEWGLIEDGRKERRH